MKTAFLINGFNTKRTAADEAFRPLCDGLEEKGYRVIAVDISWRFTTVSEFVGKFKQLYKKEKGQYNVVVGNSFGALVALFSAPELKPERLVLASISPYFQEDLKDVKTYNRGLRFGMKRLEDLRQYSAAVWAEKINQLEIPVTVTYGEKEKAMYPNLVRRNKLIAKMIKNSQLIEVSSCPHSMRDPVYTQAIIDLL